jgi:aquaporin Z
LDDKLIKESLAELIGTFTLVFVGGMAVVVAPMFGVVVPALAHGLILVGIIFVFGHISGAFVNPAVTLAVLITGKMEAPKAAAFMVMQFLGGTIAALFITTLIPNEVRSSMLNGHFNYGATTGSLTDDFVWRAAIFEAVMTFFLASVVIQAAVYGKAGNLAPIAIGLTLAGAFFAGGAFTGASLNPARTLGPAVFADNLDYIIPYFIGTFGGAALAGALHGYFFNPADS